MVMNAEIVARHEAGHAVMQWLVGWEDALRSIQIRRVEDGVEWANTDIARPGNYADRRVTRRRVLMLMAGAAATDDLTAHNEKDFHYIQMALASCFGDVGERARMSQAPRPTTQ